ncbi:alpha,alpha-trehalase nth1 [Coemansia sp. RSA 1646]|nr:alpha,alpha-trehalase nth1 [Coemansia sp. RSA 1646]KAJ1767425.1 alpha,alpha-trehalase nth1 [Coemansia sp. RSA 1843]KAJ2086068.1 alpha,alpha-trehalase nth1 [Coemansia sp. RSA 986]KAJ2210852.1 alpha,alpha-trehalase nth1 [Coemansia sp. RSA 487]
MSQSTISTVVSTTSPGVFAVTTRPMSADSVISARSKGSAGSKPSLKKEDTDDDELRGPPPRDDWDVVLDHIREYRATHEAPVDTVGCEALTEEEKDPKLKRFRSLISLMLSAQTKDEITADAVRTLSHRLSGGLSPKSLSDAPIDMVHECIRRVGFWQRKASYIKEAARTCLEQYDSDIPRTVPQLLSLPGVGPKMAYLAMHAAWQDTQGIGVDTHVLRISHRLGWVSESAKTPEATRHSLESWMPKSLWREINPILVGLGQTVCRAVGPKCGECPVSRHCPSSQVKRGGATKRGGGRARDVDQLSEDTMFGDQSQLGEVDVEDLASMVRGAEQAVRSRKNGAGRQRKQEAAAIKTEFPVIPDSPSNRLPNRIDGRAMRARARSRANSCLNPGIRSEDEGVKKRTTPETSHYFMRSRSNAASEEVRPEAKTDSVRSARAKATAKKLYSRRLSKSDMQWALGEAWDPEDDSSSMSSLSDAEPEAESKVDGECADQKPLVPSGSDKSDD